MQRRKPCCLNNSFSRKRESRPSGGGPHLLWLGKHLDSHDYLFRPLCRILFVFLIETLSKSYYFIQGHGGECCSTCYLQPSQASHPELWLYSGMVNYRISQGGIRFGHPSSKNLVATSLTWKGSLLILRMVSSATLWPPWSLGWSLLSPQCRLLISLLLTSFFILNYVQVDIMKTRLQSMKYVDGVPEYKGAGDVLAKV